MAGIILHSCCLLGKLSKTKEEYILWLHNCTTNVCQVVLERYRNSMAHQSTSSMNSSDAPAHTANLDPHFECWTTGPASNVRFLRSMFILLQRGVVVPLRRRARRNNAATKQTLLTPPSFRGAGGVYCLAYCRVAWLRFSSWLPGSSNFP